MEIIKNTGSYIVFGEDAGQMKVYGRIIRQRRTEKSENT